MDIKKTQRGSFCLWRIEEKYKDTNIAWSLSVSKNIVVHIFWYSQIYRKDRFPTLFSIIHTISYQTDIINFFGWKLCY